MGTNFKNIPDLLMTAINCIDDNWFTGLYLRSEYKFILRLALQYLIYKNKSNLMPYHNFNHTLLKFIDSVHIVSHDIGLSIQKSHAVGGGYNLLEVLPSTPEDLFALHLADIFHDFNHGGGANPDDDINIASAKSAFIDFWQDHLVDVKAVTEGFTFTRHNIVLDLNDLCTLRDKVFSIIDATRFPYDIHDGDLVYVQKVARDSDMASIFTEFSFQTNILGLYAELSKRNHRLTLNDHIVNQYKFLTSLLYEGFYTNYYNKEKRPLLDGYIKVLEFNIPNVSRG